MNGMNDKTGRLEVFGHDPACARAVVIERPGSWRATRALLSGIIGLGAAPLVFFIPPHVPWALGSVLAGAWFARRFATEARTLVSLEGSCPRCGAPITISRPTPLHSPHMLSCGKCMQGVMLTVA